MLILGPYFLLLRMGVQLNCCLLLKVERKGEQNRDYMYQKGL